MDETFEQYSRRRWSALVRAAYLMCGDVAGSEDIAQDALVRLYRVWSRRNSNIISIDAYVHRIVVNLVSRRWRERSREVLLPEVPDSEARLPDGSLSDELRIALLQLPPKMRAVVVLRFYLQMSVHDTAATLRCAEGTVKSHTSEALRRLRTTVDRGEVRNERC